MMLALKMFAIDRISDLFFASAETFTRISSLFTELSGSRTLTSLTSSCFMSWAVICFRTLSSPRLTIVILEISGLAVTPTVRLSIL